MCNTVQQVVDSNGEVIVPMYDWASYFATIYKKVTAVKKTHHFVMDSKQPGVVFTKERSYSVEKRHELLKEGVEVDFDVLPPVIHPTGLSAQRQWYLYDKIREFCPAADRDTTCPLPTAPRPDSRLGTPQPPSSPAPRRPSPTAPPPVKKTRCCGACGQPGHNKRSCTSTTH